MKNIQSKLQLTNMAVDAKGLCVFVFYGNVDQNVSVSCHVGRNMQVVRECERRAEELMSNVE